MPDIDGYALLRQIRSQETQTDSLPAIALTAYAREEDCHTAFSAGFQLHLAKPVDPDELATVIASLTGR